MNLSILRKSAAVMIPLSSIFILSCQHKAKTDNEPKADTKTAKEVLAETDREFAGMSVEQGVTAAFDSFSAENATIFRNHADPYVGKEAIHNLQSQAPPQGTLQWQPYFADVAQSGDLGYSLGKYQYTLIDSAGQTQVNEGYYVTIWKKQLDGKWKFVFDSGINGPPKNKM